MGGGDDRLPCGGIIEVADFPHLMAQGYEQRVTLVNPGRSLVGQVFTDSEIHRNTLSLLGVSSMQERP